MSSVAKTFLRAITVKLQLLHFARYFGNSTNGRWAKLCCIHHHHRQPLAQCPLVSDAILTIAAHRCLSRAAWLNSCRVVPHHCSMSSDHSRWGRPLLFEPSIIPNTRVFIFLLSFILQRKRVKPYRFYAFWLIDWLVVGYSMVYLLIDIDWVTKETERSTVQLAVVSVWTRRLKLLIDCTTCRVHVCLLFDFFFCMLLFNEIW